MQNWTSDLQFSPLGLDVGITVGGNWRACIGVKVRNPEHQDSLFYEVLDDRFNAEMVHYMMSRRCGTAIQNYVQVREWFFKSAVRRVTWLQLWMVWLGCACVIISYTVVHQKFWRIHFRKHDVPITRAEVLGQSLKCFWNKLSERALDQNYSPFFRVTTSDW